MDTQLKQQRSIVALEAYTVDDLQGLVRRVFPSIQKGMASFKNVFSSEHAIGLTGRQRDFLKITDKRTYPSLMPLTAFVPEGLKVSYLDYAQALSPAVEHACQAPSVINQYAIFLAMLVSNRSAIFETQAQTKVYTALGKERDSLNKEIGKCFTPGGNKTDVKIQDVVGRNSDWPSIMTATDDMSKAMNKVDRTHLNKKVEECVELLGHIGKAIAAGEFDKVAPAVIMDLSDGAYQVAAELEFYSVMFYRLDALCKSMDRTIAHVSKVTTPLAA